MYQINNSRSHYGMGLRKRFAALVVALAAPILISDTAVAGSSQSKLATQHRCWSPIGIADAGAKMDQCSFRFRLIVPDGYDGAFDVFFNVDRTARSQSNLSFTSRIRSDDIWLFIDANLISNPAHIINILANGGLTNFYLSRHSEQTNPNLSYETSAGLGSGAVGLQSSAALSLEANCGCS